MFLGEGLPVETTGQHWVAFNYSPSFFVFNFLRQGLSEPEVLLFSRTGQPKIFRVAPLSTAHPQCCSHRWVSLPHPLLLVCILGLRAQQAPHQLSRLPTRELQVSITQSYVGFSVYPSTIHSGWDQPKCPRTEGWIKKMGWIHSEGLFRHKE